MIEISLTELDRSNFYERTLQTLEQICDDYALENDFGTLSMANQMVCDYLSGLTGHYLVDVDFRVDSGDCTVCYSLQNGSFSALAENANGENTALFVLQSLADEVSFSTDFDTLITSFHVKTRISVQRNLQNVEVRKSIFKYS